MPGRNRWQNDPIPIPTPGGSGIGRNWLPGYQERNKEALLEILGGVQEMAEEVSKVRPETWRAVTNTIRTVGQVFGANQAIGQIQNELMMPSRIMGSQLAFGIGAQMIPLTNTLRQASASINQWIRKSTQSEGAQIMSLSLSLIGMYFGGAAGAIAGSLAGAALGHLEQVIQDTGYTPFNVPPSVREANESGDDWYSITREVASPGEEGLNSPLHNPNRPTAEQVRAQRIGRLERYASGGMR